MRNIEFQNQQNPKTQFDIIKLETLFDNKDLDHSPADLHIVKFFILLIAEQGHGKHTIDFTDYDCSKGTILTIRKDQIHRFHNTKTLEGKILLFTDDFLIKYLEKEEANKTLLLFNELLSDPKIQLNKLDFLNIQNILKRIQEEYFNINDNHSLSIIRSELHILITLLFRIKENNQQIKPNKKYLKEFLDLQHTVEKNAFNTNKVKDYSKLIGVSTKTLNTITKSIVHKSAKEFIDDICTKQIKRLLINTKLSVKEIAYKSGFEETTNFYKYFKRQTKTTPEQFRANH